MKDENEAFFRALYKTGKMNMIFTYSNGETEVIPMKKKSAREMIKKLFRYYFK